MKFQTIGAALDAALDLGAPPPLGALALALRRGLRRMQRHWLALEAALSLDDADCDELVGLLDALDGRPRPSATDPFGVLGLEVVLLTDFERRQAIATLWRLLSKPDRAAFRDAISRRRGRER